MFHVQWVVKGDKISSNILEGCVCIDVYFTCYFCADVEDKATPYWQCDLVAFREFNLITQQGCKESAPFLLNFER